jgi:hypothetical protein
MMSNDMVLMEPFCNVTNGELTLHCGLAHCREMLARVRFEETDSVLVLREEFLKLKEYREIPFYGPAQWINGIPLWVRLPEDKRAHLLMFYSFDREESKTQDPSKAVCLGMGHELPAWVACVCRGAIHRIEDVPCAFMGPMTDASMTTNARSTTEGVGGANE